MALEGGSVPRIVTVDSNQEKEVLLKQRLLSRPEGSLARPGFCIPLKNVWEFAKSDVRKAIFSLKLGVSLSLVSLLMFVKADISAHSVWAILTVVVVFEFTIGATLSKGFNRALGTLSAGGLALGVAELSTCTGQWESVMLIITIFTAGSIVTFAKLYPKMRPYEYGFRVFLLTFCFVIASGARTRSQFIHIAGARFLLIAIGAAISLAINVCIYPIWAGEDLHISLAINVCIYPIWAGEDLHKLIVKNCTRLADSIERCIDGYLSGTEVQRVSSKILTWQAAEDPIYSGYRSALVSATEEETLEGFASWEPPHGRYRMLKYPWKEYLTMAGSLRHCASVVLTLHGCILSEIQASRELRQVFSTELRRVACECVKVLREVGHNIDDMTKLTAGGEILKEVQNAAAELQKKIDTRSYLLVNSERWVIGGRSSDHKLKPRLGRSYSEFVDSTSNSNLTTESKYCKQLSWPSRSSQGCVDAEDPESGGGGALESASALSVATFASLLIELVARLHGVVHSFEELSLRANFKDPNPAASSPNEAKSFFGKLLKLIRLP